MSIAQTTRCDKCGGVVFLDASPGSKQDLLCPSCAAEESALLVANTAMGEREDDQIVPEVKRQWVVWALSFGAWSAIGIIAGISMYQVDRSFGKPASLLDELRLPLINALVYALLSPFVFSLALRNPLQRGNWKRFAAIHLTGAAIFVTIHLMSRGFLFGVWDPAANGYVYFWNPHTHVFAMRWVIVSKLFLYNTIDDILEGYVPVVLIANTWWYYRNFRSRDQRALQLEAQLAKAHLEALRSQLQPHFLFNTLHSISALMLKDVHSADKMMTRLSDLLRMSLENGPRSITTLEREIEFVNGYLEIEKVRFGERLNVDMDIRPEVLDAQVPHLLLQPLVENAVRHGIAKITSPGRIRIAARPDGRSLWLQVSDNGPGFDDASWPATGTHVGLKATRARLRTLYGDEQRLDVRRIIGDGVEVSVRIPLELKPEAVMIDEM